MTNDHIAELALIETSRAQREAVMRLSDEEARKLIVEAARALGIEFHVDGCGCCGSPFVEIHKGGRKIYEGDNFALNAEDYA